MDIIAPVYESYNNTQHSIHTNNTHVRTEIGRSFARCVVDFKVNTNFWDIMQEGYNSDINQAPLFNIGLGLNICPGFSVGFSRTIRSNFELCKFQQLLVDVDIAGPSGDRIRRFNLDNASFMADLYFNRAGDYSYLKWNIYSTSIAPYIGISVGLSKNMIYSFHTISEEKVTINEFTTNRTIAIMPYYSDNQVGWSIQAGLDAFNNSCYSLGLGYRYFDGGCLRTNNYIVDQVPQDQFRTLKVPAWHGKFTAHELVGSLSFYF